MSLSLLLLIWPLLLLGAEDNGSLPTMSFSRNTNMLSVKAIRPNERHDFQMKMTVPRKVLPTSTTSTTFLHSFQVVDNPLPNNNGGKAKCLHFNSGKGWCQYGRGGIGCRFSHRIEESGKTYTSSSNGGSQNAFVMSSPGEFAKTSSYLRCVSDGCDDGNCVPTSEPSVQTLMEALENRKNRKRICAVNGGRVASGNGNTASVGSGITGALRQLFTPEYATSTENHEEELQNLIGMIGELEQKVVDLERELAESVTLSEQLETESELKKAANVRLLGKNRALKEENARLEDENAQLIGVRQMM